MEPSVFTKIIRGDIPCHKVYEDDDTVAFLDIHPMHEGHTLIVPKQQVDHIWDLSPELYDTLMKRVNSLGKHLKNVIGTKRVGILVDGSDVPHVHIHLIPFDSGMIQKQDMEKEPNHEELAKIADKIKENL